VHEVSIVETLIEQVQSEVRRAGVAGRVLRLELIVGRLSGVNPDAVRFAFEVLAVGTPLEAAQLDIRQAPAVAVCAACARSTPIDELVAECPRCASREIRIEGGRELLLQSIEVEDS